jgi:hypothetical protein
MKPWLIGVAALSALVLAGCKGPVSTSSTGHHGRYVGIGIYAAGTAWSKMAVSDQPADPAAAKTADDDQVIVVVDSDTGEIRQCGDLTGYCVGMNPWTKSLTASQSAPVKLNGHSTESGWPADSSAASASPAPKPQ